MKYSPILLLIWSTALPVIVECQSKVASQVSLLLLDEKIPAVAVLSDAVFSLSSSTGQFEAVINLFPIVPHPDYEDTFAIRKRPLLFVLKGHFPAGDISFLTSRDNEKEYAMPCTCFVYDSARSCQVHFSLVTDQPMGNVAGSSTYQSALDFELVINPADYGLTQKPFEILKPLLVTAKNGLINKVY